MNVRESGTVGMSGERVLVLAPSAQDADVACAELRLTGIAAEKAEGGAQLAQRLHTDAALLIIAQEALSPEVLDEVLTALRDQPEWSDLPIIVLTARGVIDSPTATAVRDLLPSGSVTLLERPFSIATLVSSVRVALRARARQHQLAGLLLAQARSGEELKSRVAAVTDELERTHQALRVSERMASLGTFATGLGHDLGNLVLPLHLRLAALLERSDLPADAVQDIGALSTTTDYLAQLTRGLRHFSQDPEKGWDDPKTELESWRHEFEGLARTVVPPEMQLSIVLDKGLPAAAIPAHALTQAVVNLVHNARDALLAGPRWADRRQTITVWAGLDEDACWVRVGVSDNGPGMTEEVRGRCLEPFFTTKVRQRGTGLGLSMVHGIVRRAGGTVSVESAPGAGTSVVLRIPAAGPVASVFGRGGTRLARVTINDPRARMFVHMVLQSLHIQAEGHAGAADNAALWVTDCLPEQEESVLAFLSAGPHRRIVVTAGGHDPAIPGVVRMPAGASFGELRRLLEASVSLP